MIAIAGQAFLILQVASNAYFEGMDIFRLHTKPARPLDTGSVAPVSDAKWSRRQFSSIWAPQPQVYNINVSTTNATTVNGAANEPITEGDEVSVLFFSTQRTPLPARIREVDA